MKLNLVDIIYQSFAKEKKDKEPSELVTFAPSYLSNCGRAIFYKKTGEKPTNPPDLPALLKMGWGDILHDDIQARLSKLGYLESFEEAKTAEYEGLTFNYFYDGILNVDGMRAIMEIKTVYASGYKSIENGAKEEHILQLISYMVFEGIADGIILYGGRDNGFLKQYEFNLLDLQENTKYYDLWKSKVEKMKGLKKQIEARELPQRDFQIVMKNGAEIAFDFQKDNVKYKTDWRCSYCNFFDKCWKSEKEQIKKHKFYINGVFS